MTGEIVVGYDASSVADAALGTAIELASGLGCPLVVAYVSEPPNPSVGDERGEYWRALEELGRPPAEAAAERARAAGVDAEVVVAEGRRPADALSRAGHDPWCPADRRRDDERASAGRDRARLGAVPALASVVRPRPRRAPGDCMTTAAVRDLSQLAKELLGFGGAWIMRSANQRVSRFANRSANLS